MSLIEDVIRNIFDIIFNAVDTPPWHEFSNLSLVCRGWSWRAQALLFSYVRIQTPHQLESFLFATDPKTERGRLLGGTVRIMKVTVYPWKYVNRVPDTRLSELLSRCTRLYELRLTLEEVYIWTDKVLEELRKTSPPILALRIRDSMTKGSAARQLLHIWPSVRHLVLRSSSIGLHSVYEDEPSPKFQLFEFRYEGNHPQSIRFLQWLFRYQYEHPELGSYLRILHLSVPLADDSQGELASMYGRHLHSIRILSPDWILLKSATSLREIYLRNDEDVSEGLLLTLPPAIEHIACTTHYNRTLAIERVLQVKELGRGLESLKAMTLYCPNTELQVDWDFRWSKLAARAQRTGFNLVRQDGRSFLVGGSEDLVATGRYPRPTTIRQFGRMNLALNALPREYTSTEEEDSPLRVHAQSPLPMRPSNRATPYMRPNSSQGDIAPDQPIILDQTHITPRLWDYENDRPLDRIVLDDPKKSRPELWRSARSGFLTFKQRLAGRDA